MAFFDLSVSYNEPPKKDRKEEVILGKASRLKLATKAMELGYVGIAHHRCIEGVTNKDKCTIPLLTLGSLVKFAPSLASSVGFHRDLLGVPRATPFRQYTRLTVHVDSKSQCLSFNSGNQILKSYDIVAVRPMNQNVFEEICKTAEVDLISIDFLDKTKFKMPYPMVKLAIQRGIYFEIKYCDLLDPQKRRQVLSNAKLLVEWTKGKNLIISSGASSVTDLRGPNDVVNLMSLLGISTEKARAAISKNCRNLIAKVLKKKRFHKEAVKVELLSSSEAFSLDKPLSGDSLKWDPLSNGEGDMLLEDLAKAFDATNAVSRKGSKAIDFTSVLDGLQSHGFRVKDIVGTEPLAQQAATKMIDAPVQNSHPVSEVQMAESASSDDNLREISMVSQSDIQMSEDETKVESTTIAPLRKCITSQGQGILVPNQAAVSFKMIRCIKSDAASNVNMQTEVDSEKKSISPSKSSDGIPKSPVRNLNIESIVADEVSVERNSTEGAISALANDENYASINADDDMKIDGSTEANHNEDMDVTVEDQKLETGDSTSNIPNLSSETTDLLRETSKSISPEAVGQDQVSRLESNEAELGEEPSVLFNTNTTSEITMEDKNEEEAETETNHQTHVQSPERNNDTSSGARRAKRSRVRLPQLGPFKPFLFQSRFKRISKRRKQETYNLFSRV